MRAFLLLGFAAPLAIFGACGGDDNTGAAADGGAQDGTVGDGSSGDGSNGDGANGDGATPVGASVVQRNNSPTRDGHFLQPTITKALAAGTKMDATFAATFTGNVYASPLYVESGPGGKGAFIIATESNDLLALDETSGAVLWKVNLGTPATQSGAGCGNIGPIGVTGTPFIDLASRTIYVSAAIAGAGGNIGTHQIHARSLDDGSSRAGWPVDASTIHAVNGGAAFDPPLQNQRSSLIAVGGDLHVAYGGHAGDCGNYHGWLMVVPTANPAGAKGYRTPARGAGMWAPGGPSSDGSGVFVATGNSFGANTFQGGEAILRVGSGAAFSGNTTDYFIPSNWIALDNGDVDIGGSGPIVVDVPGATPSALVVAMSKSGVVHLLNRANLGGQAMGNGTTGEGVASAKVVGGEIINAGAAYKTAMGTYVVMHGHNGAAGTSCPNGTSGDLVAIRIGATSPPTITTAWCANNLGQGSPIVTTTDGTSNALVWTAGAEGSGRLHAFDGDTGAVVFAGGGTADRMTGVRRFTSPIAVKGRIVVAGDGHVYAFKPQ